MPRKRAARSQRDLVRIAQSWGYEYEEKGGHGGARLRHENGTTVTVNSINRAKVDSTAPHIIKALAQGVGVSQAAFLQGKPRARTTSSSQWGSMSPAVQEQVKEMAERTTPVPVKPNEGTETVSTTKTTYAPDPRHIAKRGGFRFIADTVLGGDEGRIGWGMPFTATQLVARAQVLGLFDGVEPLNAYLAQTLLVRESSPSNSKTHTTQAKAVLVRLDDSQFRLDPTEQPWLPAMLLPWSGKNSGLDNRRVGKTAPAQPEPAPEPEPEEELPAGEVLEVIGHDRDGNILVRTADGLILRAVAL